MIDTLTDRQRRLLALAILLLALGAICSITVVPVLLANQHYRETIADMEGRLEQLQRAAAIGTGLQPQYEQLRRWQETDSHYLKSSSSALAAAELQRLVKRIVVAQHAEVLSTQILTTAQEQDLNRISLKLRIRGTLENIVQVFYAIETSEPFMFLDNISIRAKSVRRTLSKIPAPQLLDMDLELIGYMPHSS
jgi:general secretion pathway protein M